MHKSFEDRAHQSNGVESWRAREPLVLLGYTLWRNFELVIEQAKVACSNAGQPVGDHFADVGKMVGVAGDWSSVGCEVPQQ